MAVGKETITTREEAACWVAWTEQDEVFARACGDTEAEAIGKLVLALGCGIQVIHEVIVGAGEEDEGEGDDGE